MRIDRRLLGWGAFLVIAGAIPLAVRAGAISAQSLSEWPSLWPLLLVGAGLTLILRRTPVHLLGGTVSVLTAGVMLGALLASGFHGFPAFGACGPGSGGTAFPDQHGSLGPESAVRIEFNCGKLDVRTATQDGWTFSGSGPADRAPVVEEDSSSVRIAAADRSTFGFSDPAATWNVTVPEAPTLSLSLTLNAGEGIVDLAGANVAGFDMTLNAGSLTADLSAAGRAGDISATVNAGSAAISLPASAGSASVTVNAGDMKLCVPAGTAMRISWGGALASNNFDSLGLIRVDDNHWTTAGPSDPAIDINASANAGSFTLVIGGSCHA
jgi:hypothetical protein